MVKSFKRNLIVASSIALSGCWGDGRSDENLAYYQSQLAEYETTQSEEAICNAASVIGNRQRSFPYPMTERRTLFIQHIKTGLDAAARQGLTAKNSSCTTKLWNDLYVMQTAIIDQSRDMVDCLDEKRVNGIYTSAGYDTCAEALNYTP